jgi:NTE family protein
MANRHHIPEKQRAFVFAGGGSQGAYEAGAYKSTYEFIKKSDKPKE